MKHWVVTRKTGLLHLAKWLSDELPGEVRTGTLNEYADKFAWKGLVKKERIPVRDGIPKLLEGFDGVLVTDDQRWTEVARELGVRCFGTLAAGDDSTRSGVSLGGWWDGTGLVAAHWAVTDWGLWPGGLGPVLAGGFSLIAPTVPPPLALLEPLRGELAGFLGYLTLDLAWDGEVKAWRSGTLRAGWGHHAGHLPMALLQGCASASEVLAGKEPALAPFTVAVPASTPPYPFSGRERPAAVPLPSTPEIQSALVLSDVTQGRQGLESAGVDGAVALAIGRGRTPGAARAGALAAAQALALPQWRPDAGANLDTILTELERIGWF